MDDSINDRPLRDLIAKVQRLVSLRDALPNRSRMTAEMVGKYEKLCDSIDEARFEVEQRWMYLENMEW